MLSTVDAAERRGQRQPALQDVNAGELPAAEQQSMARLQSLPKRRPRPNGSSQM